MALALLSALNPLHSCSTPLVLLLFLHQSVSTSLNCLIPVKNFFFNHSLNQFLIRLSSVFGPPPPPPRPAAVTTSVWQDRTIASAKLRLLEYSAFMETQRDRDTVLTFVFFFFYLEPLFGTAVTDSLFCRSDSINTFSCTWVRLTRALTTQSWNQ